MKYRNQKTIYNYDLLPPTCRDCKNLGRKLQVKASGSSQMRLFCRKLNIYTQAQAVCDAWVGIDGAVLEV